MKTSKMQKSSRGNRYQPGNSAKPFEPFLTLQAEKATVQILLDLKTAIY
jgi:hypothetical protein